MRRQFKNAIVEYLDFNKYNMPDKDVKDFVAIIKSFKECGISREYAYYLLKEIRAEYPWKNKSSILLSVMDVVCDYQFRCYKKLKIW